MGVDENRLLCRRLHDEIFAKGELDVADQIFAADARYHGPDWPTGATGPEVIKQDATVYRSAFRIEQLSRDLEVAEGDYVVHHWTFSGTHIGDLGPIQATGRKATASGIDIFRVQGGKIAEIWQQWDQLSLMQQLGAVPTAQPA